MICYAIPEHQISRPLIPEITVDYLCRPTWSDVSLVFILAVSIEIVKIYAISPTFLRKSSENAVEPTGIVAGPEGKRTERRGSTTAHVDHTVQHHHVPDRFDI